MNKITSIILLMLILGACSSKKTSEQKSVIQQPDKTESAEVKNPQENSMNNHPGKKVYEATCLACHMRNGTGVPGMHPPLTESEFVNGDPDKLITIILKGISGKVEVKGEIYNSIMPAQAHLTDQQIADVLTFTRGSFGNNSGPVTPDQVKKIRDSL